MIWGRLDLDRYSKKERHVSTKLKHAFFFAPARVLLGVRIGGGGPAAKGVWGWVYSRSEAEWDFCLVSKYFYLINYILLFW